jgi:PIN domain nuclease of toxin-antitoxin system
MTWLVDTQCWLWMKSRPDRFTAEVRARLADSRTILLFSAASAWEIAIKYALKKLRLPAPPVRYVATRLGETRMTPLSVSWEHAVHVSGLPLHHRDPFDRLLIAQAQIEKVPILSDDDALARYDVEIIRP